MTTSVMWFRADLRLHDQPALRAAIEAGPDGVVPLGVADPYWWQPGASARSAYISRLLRDWDERIGGFHVRRGRPVDVVVDVAREVDASSVHISADFTPYGAERDAAVERALAEHGISLVRTGSPYAVSPGRIVKGDGTPYRVYTPFYRAWLEHGWRQPPPPVTDAPWLLPETPADAFPEAPIPDGLTLPPIGEAAALARWAEWRQGIAEYDDIRDLPGLDRTSRLSVPLKWGTIHPRTLLADLAGDESAGARSFIREIAFREFYADVLHHRPDSETGYYNRALEAMDYDEPGPAFEAWCQGRTGYPIVDAGMRQLLAEGWMHNRVRMIVASFLIKDLHIEWTHGARWFLDRLVDADLASNQHGWQWVAGCGTDASPYYRIFNPVTQGKKFDPDGSYVHRWIPELREVPGPGVHEPWTLRTRPLGYPGPIVDHAAERLESLRRYEAVKQKS